MPLFVDLHHSAGIDVETWASNRLIASQFYGDATRIGDAFPMVSIDAEIAGHGDGRVDLVDVLTRAVAMLRVREGAFAHASHNRLRQGFTGNAA
ncbi:hypothetical protein ASD28_04305 [Massilia sp. Root133]|nr:hypothetical protein ASD28_04305 [Massilia sp. Root133]KQZ34402.1 hypothetical protein ASD92_08855 [Massilia sp. Root1485]